MPLTERAIGPSPDLKPTIGFVCPLYRELAAVKAIFDEQLEPRSVRSSDGDLESEYHYGRIGNRIVVAVSFADKKVGPSWAAVHAERLLNEHETLKHDGSSFFLVGIAAGISKREDVRLGDVVIATQVVDWTSGKIVTGSEFEPTEHAQDVSNAVQLKTARFCDNITRLGERLVQKVAAMNPEDPEDKFLWECPGPDRDKLYQSDVQHVEGVDCRNCEQRIQEREPRDPYLPKVHRGLIAAGNVVLKDADTRERIRRDFRDKALAVEMEAHGVLTSNKRFIIIRGICDYGDAHKNKVWQHYSAAVAAACARLWIEDTDRKRRKSINRKESLPALSRLSTTDTDRSRRSRHSSTSTHSDSTTNTNDSDHPPKDNSKTKNATEDRDQVDPTFDGPQHDDAMSWKTLAEFDVVQAEISIFDGITGTSPNSTVFNDTHLAFELKNDDHPSRADRRVRLSETSHSDAASCVLWVPHAQVWASNRKNRITIHFSNCNQSVESMQGNFKTKNGVALYTAGYNPMNPNVSLDLRLHSSTDAAEIYELFLARDNRLFSPEHSERQSFSHCSIMTSMSPKNEAQPDIVHLWSSIDDCESSDMGSFTQKLDFSLFSQDDSINLCLGYVDKFIYKSVDIVKYSSRSDMPTKVKENYDGRPGSVSWGGGDSITNDLKMVVTRDEICNLLSETIGSVVSWKMKAFASDVGVVLVRRSHMRGNSDLGLSQLSGWRSDNGEARLFVRTSTDRESRWVACTPTSESTFQTEKQRNTELKDVIFHCGNYISSDTFLPTEAEEEGNTEQEFKAMRLKFADVSDVGAFESLFK